MLCKFKASGLVLVGILAIGAIAASAASAQGLLTSDGPVTLRGVNELEPAVNAWTVFGANTKCPNAVYTGHKFDETPHKFIPSGATSITISPHYGTCVLDPGNLPTTVDMNGCDYVFDFLAKVSADTYGIKTTVVCPSKKHITVTFFKNAAEHAANKPFCHYVITENAAGYLGVHATDLTNGHLTISGVLEGIFVDRNFEPPSILCSEATFANAKLDLALNLEGRNEAGATTSVSLSG